LHPRLDPEIGLPLFRGRAPRGSTEQERIRTEALLARYPHVSSVELEELRHWFHRRATAADVARLACNERLYQPYRAFRRLHVDPFKWWQKVAVAILTLFPIALVAAALAGEA